MEDVVAHTHTKTIWRKAIFRYNGNELGRKYTAPAPTAGDRRSCLHNRERTREVELSPLRILVIAVLLYIGYRLITGGRKSSSGSADEGRGTDGPVVDELVVDPVCHSLVPKQQAIKLRHHGETVYFCSEACCDEFVARDTGER